MNKLIQQSDYKKMSKEEKEAHELRVREELIKVGLLIPTTEVKDE